jgi:hypothetical protein
MSQAMLDRQLNECLTVELGWPEVAKGLTKVLMGYGIWIIGNIAGLALVLLPLFEVGFKLDSVRLKLGQLWMFYAGLGILSIVGIFSFAMIRAGKWKCVINAAERNHGRWLLFVCLASLAMTAALSVLSSLAGVKVQPEFNRGVAGFGQMRFSTAGVIFNLASGGLSMVYTCTFALFLRSVAQCMDSRWHVRMVDLFLSFFVPLSIASGYVGFKLVTGNLDVTKTLLLVGGAWVGCFFYWLVMIALVRSCILRTLERVKDPMAYSSMAAQAKAPKRKYSYT